MKFPKFWLKQNNLKYSALSMILAPLSLVWKTCSLCVAFFGKNEIMPIPVVCIGNITVGGNGKTPTVIKCLKLLRNLGFRPQIVSKGYKSKLKGPLLVCPKTNSHTEVGDEPLMLAAYGPTWISKKRTLGVRSALNADANIVILDDGFQNNSIAKDFSIVVVDTSVGFGNGKIIPAGPLRESISVGLDRANIIIAIGSQDEKNAFEAELNLFTDTEVIHGRLTPCVSSLNLRDKEVVCFAGIAHPKKFFRLIESLGAKIIKTHSFPNHKSLKENQLETLIAEAKKSCAYLVTTEKDFVRVPAKYKEFIYEIKVELTLDHEETLCEKLRKLHKSV